MIICYRTVVIIKIKIQSPMKQFLISLFTLVTVMSITPQQASAFKPMILELRIIETSDVHGCFFPYNFTERKPMAGTMARVSTYLNEQRKLYGDNVIVIDNGDILQGQPVCYYTNFVKTDRPNIAAEVVNYLKYDA